MNFVDKFINLKEEGGKSERDREFVFFQTFALESKSFLFSLITFAISFNFLRVCMGS